MARLRSALASVWSFVANDMVGRKTDCPRCHYRTPYARSLSAVWLAGADDEGRTYRPLWERP